MAAAVRMYTTPFCGYCVLAKRVLAKKKAPFEEIDVSNRPELRTWLAQTTGQRTVPQIFVNGRSVGGFRELSALETAGDLDQMLGEAPPAEMPPLPR